MNRQKFDSSTPLSFEVEVDGLSAPQGSQALSWDPELLKPFLPQGESDPQPPETVILKQAMAEGTAYLLYQRMKEEADSELQSGWLFLKLQQSYYLNLVQNIY